MSPSTAGLRTGQARTPTFKDITATGTSEEVVTSKTARAAEEVVVGRTETDRTETVHDTVRRTDVEAESLSCMGDAPKRGC